MAFGSSCALYLESESSLSVYRSFFFSFKSLNDITYLESDRVQVGGFQITPYKWHSVLVVLVTTKCHEAQGTHFR